MIAFDELFEFLREAELTCDNFNEQVEEQEAIILFLNELKLYIADLSLSLKHKINASDDVTEHDILKKIINKKESLEWVLRNKRDAFLGEDHSGGSSSPLICVEGANRGVNADASSKVSSLEKEHPTPSHSLSFTTQRYNNVEPSPTGGEAPNEQEFPAKESPAKESPAKEPPATAQLERNESYDQVETLNDEVLKEWSEQIDEYDNLLYEYSFAFKKNDLHKKMEFQKNMNKSGENIDEELCLLAQEMKENVLTYRNIIVEDNRMLEQSANKQLSNLDNITDVYRKTKKMGQSKSISFFVSLLIIAASALLFVLTFFVILIL
ncbi:conserved Plasmodium protein, unknown function [Plasmodium vivax]|uniref:Uncharacterized protein n=2 Tax=Plasmodium vivax TaxID=5855 RepID=A0A1G4GQW2_PLAVI|nr:hypothetical protein PVIIG_05526 [Plasmodium vivax India VII]CAI7717727.1 protein transport protein USE1, putative [Plasmodium vivax]SCO64963.1 conserved Plasmodium protein, unknown function [Plasmodium vivax]SCO70454.1 conserved Plasmodium protein, unknown function [Plasmodium vivax]